MNRAHGSTDMYMWCKVAMYLGNWESKVSKEGEWKKEEGNGVNKYQIVSSDIGS